MNDLFIPDDYVSRETMEPFDDVDDGLVWQDAVYAEAKKYAEGLVIDIGCGRAREWRDFQLGHVLGVDRPEVLAALDVPLWKTVAANFEEGLPEEVFAAAPRGRCTDSYDVVVVCADVIEHLKDPRPLLQGLRKLRWNGCKIIISTPDRSLIPGARPQGPPLNPGHVREWTLDEFRELLQFHDFMGGSYTHVAPHAGTQRVETILATFRSRVMRMHSSNGCHYKGCSVCGGNGKCYSSACEICNPRGEGGFDPTLR